MDKLGVSMDIPLGTVVLFLERCPLCWALGEPYEYPQRFITVDV
jgi:hypothetical protein